MYLFHLCEKITDSLFDEKIISSKKEELIQEHNLNKIGTVKEYWENNVQILYRDNQFIFNYVYDKSISYDEDTKALIQEYECEECPKYTFFEVGIEEEYILYEKQIEGKTIRLKEYNDYLTMEIDSPVHVF
jgi:acetone carboxylase gamma subunit